MGAESSLYEPQTSSSTAPETASTKESAMAVETSTHQVEDDKDDPLPAFVHDDQAIQMNRQYGKTGNKVVLDFSKGNDQAKIVVYSATDDHAVDKKTEIEVPSIPSKMSFAD